MTSITRRSENVPVHRARRTGTESDLSNIGKLALDIARTKHPARTLSALRSIVEICLDQSNDTSQKTIIRVGDVFTALDETELD